MHRSNTLAVVALGWTVVGGAIGGTVVLVVVSSTVAVIKVGVVAVRLDIMVGDSVGAVVDEGEAIAVGAVVTVGAGLLTIAVGLPVGVVVPDGATADSLVDVNVSDRVFIG